MSEAVAFAVALGVTQGFVGVLMIVGVLLLVFCVVGAILDIRNSRQ